MLVADWVRLARWPEWAQSKLPFAGAAALLLASPSWPDLLAIMATISLWAAFGYGVNEVADRRPDRAAGKPNRAAGLSNASWICFLALTSTGALGLSLVWAVGAAGPLSVLIGLVLALAYSVPPLRLKERGLVGLAGAAGAQWSLPVLAVSGAEAEGWAEPATWSFALLGFALGMRWMANHQRLDVAADRRSGVSTYASVGANVDRVVLGAFLSELILLVATLVFAWPHSIAAVVGLALWLCFELAFLGPRLGPLRTRLRAFEGAPLAGYYFVVLPLALAVDRGPSWPGYGLVVALFLTLSSPYLFRMLRWWSRRPQVLGQQQTPSA